MNTLEFLQTVVPDDGITYLVLFTKRLNERGEPFKVHKPFSDLETMAAMAAEYDADPQYLGVYHACGSYQRPFIELDELNAWGKPKRQFRVPANWSRAKAFWVDIDCGAEKAAAGKGYETKTLAAKAIFGFADAIGWPRPMLVDSGGGLHVYWPLAKAIRHEAWCKVAALLKAALAHFGVIADPTRTADFASILRPVGMTNRKEQYGEAGRAVALKSTCAPCDPAELAASLNAVVKLEDIKVAVSRPPQVDNGLNSELTALLAPQAPSYGAELANHCAQVALMRDTRGDVDYDHWRGVIGILKHCEDGLELAEAWSADRHLNHTNVDWQTKWDTWSSGPATCEFFASRCNPTGCTGCLHKDKITSPIQLGRIVPKAHTIEVEALDDEGQEVKPEVDLPDGYEWRGGMLTRAINVGSAEEGGSKVEHVAFCRTLFYPIARIRGEDGAFRVKMAMHLPDKRVRYFEMASNSLASPTDMLRALGTYEIWSSNVKGATEHMTAYLKDQMEALKRRAQEMNTLTSFGWKGDDSFLVGNRLYHRDGTVREAYLGAATAHFSNAFPTPRGTLQGYADAIDRMYNHPGAEHWQYALCSGWGSVLTPFGENLYNGLLLALQGGDSGKGKTTVCFASLYAFGDAARMTIKSKDGATYNGLWKLLGTFNNVPLLLDELTNMDAKMFSDVAYGVSNGQDKVRMTGQNKNGEHSFVAQATWKVSPFITGNKDFHGLLAQNQVNSQAEAVRLIQINVDRYPRIELDADPQREAQIVQDCVDAMRDNMGVAGDVMLQYVMVHRDEVKARLRDTMTALTKHLPETKYRMYRNHAACTLTMGWVAKQCGVASFDLRNLYVWTVKLLRGLADDVSATNTVSLDEAFHRMMTALAPRILVTAGFRSKTDSRGVETPRNRTHGELAGRYVLGSTNDRTHAGWLMLVQKEVRDWCMANRLDYEALLDRLERDGALIKRQDRVTITRGTDYPTIQARVLVVDATRLDRDGVALVPTSQQLDAIAV